MASSNGDFQSFVHDHEDIVLAVDFNFTGTRMVTASSDHRLKVWDRSANNDWTLLDNWKAHSAEIVDVKWSSPFLGQILGTVAEDGRFRLWEEDVTEAPHSGRRFTTVFELPSSSFVPFASLSFKWLLQETYLALITRDGHLTIHEPADAGNVTEWSLVAQTNVCRCPSRSQETGFKVVWHQEQLPCYTAIAAGLDRRALSLAVAAMNVIKIYRTDYNRRFYVAAELTGARSLIRDVAWANGSMRGFDVIATASKDGVVRVYEISTPDKEEVEEGYEYNCDDEDDGPEADKDEVEAENADEATERDSMDDDHYRRHEQEENDEDDDDHDHDNGNYDDDELLQFDGMSLIEKEREKHKHNLEVPNQNQANKLTATGTGAIAISKKREHHHHIHYSNRIPYTDTDQDNLDAHNHYFRPHNRQASISLSPSPPKKAPRPSNLSHPPNSSRDILPKSTTPSGIGVGLAEAAIAKMDDGDDNYDDPSNTCNNYNNNTNTNTKGKIKCNSQSDSPKASVRGRIKQEAKLVAELTKHRGAVWRIAFSLIGDLLVSTGDDGTVKTWKKAVDESGVQAGNHGSWLEYAEIKTSSATRGD